LAHVESIVKGKLQKCASNSNIELIFTIATKQDKTKICMQFKTLS